MIPVVVGGTRVPLFCSDEVYNRLSNSKNELNCVRPREPWQCSFFPVMLTWRRWQSVAAIRVSGRACLQDCNMPFVLDVRGGGQVGQAEGPVDDSCSLDVLRVKYGVWDFVVPLVQHGDLHKGSLSLGKWRASFLTTLFYVNIFFVVCHEVVTGFNYHIIRQI